MKLKAYHSAILSSIGGAALLAYVLACGGTSFSPDDTQVLYPVFDSRSGNLSVAVYDRKTGLSEPVFTACSALPESKKAALMTRAQWLPDGKNILIAHTHEKNDKTLSILIVPRGVKEPVRQLGNLELKEAIMGILYPFSIAGSTLVLNDEKTLTRMDLMTGQTLRCDNTNKVMLIPGGNDKEILAMQGLKGENEGSAFGTLDAQTMSFTPSLILTNCSEHNMQNILPAFDPNLRQVIFVTEEPTNRTLKVMNEKGLAFSRTLACESTNATLEKLGPWLLTGPKNDRVWTCYLRKETDAKENDAEFGLVEIPLNRDPLRRIALFRIKKESEVMGFVQPTLSHDGQTIALASICLVLDDEPLIKTEDCALYLVEVGQAEPKITKVPIALPQRAANARN